MSTSLPVSNPTARSFFPSSRLSLAHFTPGIYDAIQVAESIHSSGPFDAVVHGQDKRSLVQILPRIISFPDRHNTLPAYPAYPTSTTTDIPPTSTSPPWTYLFTPTDEHVTNSPEGLGVDREAASDYFAEDEDDELGSNARDGSSVDDDSRGGDDDDYEMLSDEDQDALDDEDSYYTSNASSPRTPPAEVGTAFVQRSQVDTATIKVESVDERGYWSELSNASVLTTRENTPTPSSPLKRAHPEEADSGRPLKRAHFSY